MTNRGRKYLPDRTGIFDPGNTGTSWTPAGRIGRRRRGWWLCTQHTGDKIPEIARERRREDTGGGGEADGETGPGAQRRKSEGAEARRTRMGPKPPKEYEGGEAHGEDDDGDECPWLCVEEKEKSGEKQKEFYTNHVTGSDRDNRASGTAERSGSLRQPGPINLSEEPERPGRPETRKLNTSSLKGCVAQYPALVR